MKSLNTAAYREPRGADWATFDPTIWRDRVSALSMVPLEEEEDEMKKRSEQMNEPATVYDLAAYCRQQLDQGLLNTREAFTLGKDYMYKQEEILELNRLQVLSRAMAEAGYPDKATIIALGVTRFSKTSFGEHGGAFKFLNKVLKGELEKRIDLAHVLKAADLLMLPRFSNVSRDKCVALLASKGIRNRKDLLALGPIAFQKLHFEPYGMGQAFLKFVLGKSVRQIHTENLVELADAMGFHRDSQEHVNADALSLLRANKITDLHDLMHYGIPEFLGASFGDHGKGQRFLTDVLGPDAFSRVKEETLRMLAEKVSLPTLSSDKIKKCKVLLETHQIYCLESLLNVGPVPFQSLEMGSFGKGHALAVAVLGRKIGRVTVSVLHEIAGCLELPRVSGRTLERHRNALHSHGIYGREELMATKTSDFERLSFPEHGGKGKIFSSQVLMETHACISAEVRSKIADRLGW